jgi:hypothetical protein
MNREEWLLGAKDHIAERFFNKPSKRLPAKLALSCGIPKGSSRAIGQCWDPRVAADGTTHIFVCPSLDNPIEVLGTLLHELVHACVGIKEGHGGQFARMAREVGLCGKLTSTVVEEGTDLHMFLLGVVGLLGPYPHKAMNKQGTKRKAVRTAVRLYSSEIPGYSVSIKASVLEEMGYPLDPDGNEMTEEKPAKD